MHFTTTPQPGHGASASATRIPTVSSAVTKGATEPTGCPRTGASDPVPAGSAPASMCWFDAGAELERVQELQAALAKLAEAAQEIH